MQQLDFNKYIGIPYVEKGRSEKGVDCWGLVRLAYKQELGIDLPSFSADYEVQDTSRLEELFSQYKEGWEVTQQPEVGDVVLFRILGNVSHIGIVIDEARFIHSREGHDVAVERFTAGKWKTRVEGFYKYKQNTGVVLNAAPHPLRTERITTVVPEGATLKEVVDYIQQSNSISTDLHSSANFFVNSILIPEQEWDSFKLKASDVVEYRSILKGDSTKRLLLTLVVTAAAIYTGGQAATLFNAGSFAATAAQVGASAVVMAAGTFAINKLVPIKPPTSYSDSQGKAQELLNGSRNELLPYGGIPVVLGKVRMTPPLGSRIYSELSSGANDYATESFLRLLLVWGYGPLSVDLNTLKIGDIVLNGTNFEDYTVKTIDYSTTPSAGDLTELESIYGKDYYQVTPNTELVADGDPGTRTSGVNYPNTVIGNWFESAILQTCNSIAVSITFPQGLRAVAAKGDSAGKSFDWNVGVDIQYKIGTGGTWTNLGTGSYLIGDGTVRKDGFTWTKSHDFGNETADNVYVRVRRTTGDNTDSAGANPSWQFQHAAILTAVTGVNNQNPAVNPTGAQIAKTALRIKAKDNLNGTLEGINAIVQTRCLDWNGTAWVVQNTSNPASLFRYVLQHSANSRKVADAKLDLPALQAWHTYCSSKGFEYNNIIQDPTSILEVLKEIATAGRASPTMVDGKWSIIIDTVKSTVVQHFSPHNSWGFEGSKSLPKLPHALKVVYNDEDQEYRQLEKIIPYTGYTHETAELFETVSLPGVTKSSSVIDHARWHMAVAKLRPEVYTLNTDIEYLVCNRGDRVKVMHDVPMWGTGSGRIKTKLSGFVFELDEEVFLDSTKTYTVRFRSPDGTSTTRTVVNSFTPTQSQLVSNVVTITLSSSNHSIKIGDRIDVDLSNNSYDSTAVEVTNVVGASISFSKTAADITLAAVTGTVKLTSDYYQAITVNTTIADNLADDGDLFLIGELNKEAVDLIVLSIEPLSNKSARLTLIDYGVTADYNLFTDYTDYTNALIFEPQITTPALNRTSLFGTKVPSVIAAYSASEEVVVGVYQYNLKGTLTHAVDLPSSTSGVEVQLNISAATDNTALKSQVIAATNSGFTFSDVTTGETYKLRARYLSNTGEVGNWSDWNTSTVTAKTVAVLDVSSLTVTSGQYGTSVLFNWDANLEPDVIGYELRTANSNWGTDTNYLFKGNSTNFSINTVPTVNTTYYLKAYDNLGNYSTLATSALYTVSTPTAPTLTATAKALSVELSWVFGDSNSSIVSTEIYSSLSNDRATATLLADVSFPSNTFLRTGLNSSVGHYYWIRVKNTNQVYSAWYPVSSTAGVFGQADTTSSSQAIISHIAGDITESELSGALNTRIDLIDAPSTTAGSVNQRLQTEVNTINDQIQIESHVRLTSVQEAANAALEAALAANQERVDRTADVALARTELNQNIVDGVAAEASQRTLLAAQLRGGYTGNDLNAVTSGLFYQERLARAEQDNALALSISLLAAGVGEQFDWKSIWYFDSGVDGWSGNGTPTVSNGFLRPANQASSAYVTTPTALEIDTAKYAQVRLRIKKTGSPTFAGYLWWNAVSQSWDTGRRSSIAEPTFDGNGIAVITLNLTWSATASVDQIRIDLSSAQTATDYFEIDWFAVGRPSPAASTAQLLEEQIARAAADSAEVTSRETLATSLFGATNPTGVTLANITSGLIYDERTSRISADSSLQTLINTLNSTVYDEETGLVDTVSQNTSDIGIIYQTTADLESASSESVLELRSVSKKLDETPETVLLNLLTGETNKVRVETTVALTRQELKTDIVEGLSAEASARLTLETKVDTNQATLVNNYYTKSSVDGAIAQSGNYLRAYSNLGSKTFTQTTAPTTRGTDPETAQAVALQVGDLWLDTDDGNKPYRWNGTSWVVSQDASIAAVDARVTTVETTKIGYCVIGGSASDHTTKSTCEAAGGTWAVGIPLATAVKQVSVSAPNGGVASIESAMTAQQDLNDEFKLQYSVKLDNNGNVSGFGLYNQGTNSKFVVSSDTFAVATPSSSLSLWAASTSYLVGRNIRVATDNARMLVCKVAGTSGGTVPSLAGKATGEKIVDGTVTWQIASRVPFVVTTTSTTVENSSFDPGVYIDGAFIAPQTVSPDSIDTRGLLVKDNNGNVLFGVGNALNWSNITAQPSGIYNSNVSISSAGELSGAGGGQVTIGGLGYSGDLDATKGATFGTNIYGQITSGNISTYIASAAITDAYIANATISGAKIASATITDANIADLSATKITTGTLDAARIGAESITTDKIEVGAVSAFYSQNVSYEYIEIPSGYSSNYYTFEGNPIQVAIAANKPTVVNMDYSVSIQEFIRISAVIGNELRTSVDVMVSWDNINYSSLWWIKSMSSALMRLGDNGRTRSTNSAHGYYSIDSDASSRTLYVKLRISFESKSNLSGGNSNFVVGDSFQFIHSLTCTENKV